MRLNEAQTTAVKHNKGPMLVLAGPGSGKTAVITERTRYLIEHYGAAPHNILVITFTKAAAQQMKNRFRDQMGGICPPVRFGTFHGIFFTILKHAYHYNAGNILRDDQKKQFLREILLKLNLDMEDEQTFLADIESEISLVKGERIPLSNYYPVNCSGDVFTGFYKMYEEKLIKHNLLDFDDMLCCCYDLLSNREDILKLWQQQFKYILIDEFQDINRVQYDIIRMLAEPEQNLFIVGDDDQSIYHFRGARPEIMLGFETDYPGAGRAVLNMNYRSTGNIVSAASRVIEHNKIRFDKAVRTDNAEGEPVCVRQFAGLRDENRQIVEQILDQKRKGTALGDIAVLFRTNTQPRALVEKLMEYNIPFHMKDAVPNIYEHWIAADMKAYLRLAAGGRDRGDFLKIMNRPKRYLSREYIDSPVINFERLRTYYEDKEWMMDRIDRMEYDLNVIRDLNPYAAVRYIRRGVGYDEYLSLYAACRGIKASDLYEVLDEIETLAREYDSFDEWFTHMEEYGRELALKVKEWNDSSEDALTLATMHSSKGLEYKIVYVIDVNEGIMPHRKASLNAELEEERRMFYVAMTRAREQLYLYCVKERYNKELQPSRFLKELGAEKLLGY